MGGNMSKYGVDGFTSLSDELDVDTIKDKLRQMNRCRYKQTNYVFNSEYRIKLYLKDKGSIVIALSNDGRHVVASSVGLWMYLDSGTNPLYELFV
jgi:hypothetical protein